MPRIRPDKIKQFKHDFEQYGTDLRVEELIGLQWNVEVASYIMPDMSDIGHSKFFTKNGGHNIIAGVRCLGFKMEQRDIEFPLAKGNTIMIYNEAKYVPPIHKKGVKLTYKGGIFDEILALTDRECIGRIKPYELAEPIGYFRLFI